MAAGVCTGSFWLRGVYLELASGFGMQAPYVTRLIRNTGENFLNLSGSFLDVCGAAVVRGCYTTAPPPPPPLRLSRPRAPAVRADGAAGERGRRQEPAAGSGGLGKGVTLGSH